MNSVPGHRIEPSPETVHWGFFDGRLSPQLEIKSGETVTISTVSGPPEMMPAPPLRIPAALTAIHEKVTRKMVPGHICTGPVAISGAKPGQVLQVDIEAIEVLYDWGYSAVRPLAGALPHDFDDNRLFHIVLDRRRNVWLLPWGQEIPVAPFFGVMGVAPPIAWGTVSTLPPRRNGGNLDNKELVAGTTLFIPVHVKGALFEAGDGHAGQGNGEVDITAMETWLTGTFKFVVHKDRHLRWPRAETPTSYISMGFDDDLKTATEMAVRNMIDFLVEEKHLSRDDAYALVSVAVDVDITQLVDGKMGVHALCPKNIFSGK